MVYKELEDFVSTMGFPNVRFVNTPMTTHINVDCCGALHSEYVEIKLLKLSKDGLINYIAQQLEKNNTVYFMRGDVPVIYNPIDFAPIYCFRTGIGHGIIESPYPEDEVVLPQENNNDLYMYLLIR